jgi:hypothetical protein
MLMLFSLLKAHVKGKMYIWIRYVCSHDLASKVVQIAVGVGLKKMKA